MPVRTYSRLVAIVGRPNVGKSTLFNRIVKERKSLVHDEPGVTRDRIFARAEFEGTAFYLCDTGGFEPTSRDNIKVQLVEQAELAIEEADCVVFVTDAREGLHPVDAELIKRLRKGDKKFLVAANKCDLPRDDYMAEEFRKLGVEEVFPISAEHNRGVGDLLERVTDFLKTRPALASERADAIKLALIGRPNVGKSSILNRLAGETRSIVDDRPGTTRDTVDITLRAFGRELRVLDTAGIRRKSRMVDNLEKFSALRSVSNLEECDVAVLVIDAKEGPTEGDARVAGFAFELRKPIIVVVNKWDLIEDKDNKTVAAYTERLHEALRYIRYAPVVFVSASENQRISRLLPLCIEMYDESSKRVSTSELNKTFKGILESHTPPLSRGRARRIKFYYATQVGALPPRFVIFCTDPEDVHFSYRRFLENSFRTAFGFSHVPVAIHLRERARNPLTALKDSGREKAKANAAALALGGKGRIDRSGLDKDLRDYMFGDEEEEAFAEAEDMEIEYTDEDSED